MEVASDKIGSADMKKCGEITTLLSVGRKEFFLNCGFCSFTFCQLDNFIQHISEEHLYQFTILKLEEEVDLPLELAEELEEVDEQMQAEYVTEETDEGNATLRNFERVEIEFDETAMSDAVHVKDAKDDDYGSDWNEDTLNKTDSDFDIDSELPEEKDEEEPEELNDDADFAASIELLNLGAPMDKKTLLAICKSYEKRTSLWDADVPRYSKSREKEMKDITSEVGLGKDYRTVQKLIGKLSSRLRTEMIRKKIYTSKGKQYSPLWHTDINAFIRQKKPSAPAPTSRSLVKKIRTPASRLSGEECVMLAQTYRQFPALWDVNDLTHYFSNRRREAAQQFFVTFSQKCDLQLSKDDVDSEISRLRKICSCEKKRQVLCKLQNKIYKPAFKYYEHIKYLEDDVAPYECPTCGKLIGGSQQFKLHLSSHDGLLPFKCIVCEHRFRCYNNWVVHLRRHAHDYTYNCNVCNKRLATTTELKIHMRIHTGERPFICEFCGNAYKSLSDLKVHMSQHDLVKRFNCEVCTKSFFKKSRLTEHMSVHTKIRSKICNICDKGFTTSKHLRQHMQIHAAEKKYECKICRRRFAQYAGLSNHVKCHGTTLPEISSKIVEPIEALDEGEGTSKSAQIGTITASETKPKCMPMPKDITLNNEQCILLANIYKSHSCLWDDTDITYRFTNRRKDALKAIHEQFNELSGLSLTQDEVQNEIAKFRKTCSAAKKHKLICQKEKTVFTPTCQYYEHIEYLEVNVAPFQCSICEKVLSGIIQYSVHVASHDGSLPFKCNICGHGFKETTNLAVHLRRHVQEYNYKCEVCDKKMTTSSEKKIHMRIHTGEKPYVCDYCGISFTTSSKIVAHRRRHEKVYTHWCEICNKGFFSKGLHREHMAVHGGERNSICDVCNKGFKTVKHLSQHKLIHSDEKKYKCKICGKRFAQHAGISGHMKSHGTTLAIVNRIKTDD